MPSLRLTPNSQPRAYFCSRPVTLSLSALNWPLVPLGGPAPLGGPTLLVVQPGGHHLYFPASHKPSLLAKLDGTTHLCLSPPLPPMSLPVLVPAAPTARLPDPEPYSDPPLTTGALLPPFPVPQDSELPEGQVQPLLRLRCPLCGQHGQGPTEGGTLGHKSGLSQGLGNTAWPCLTLCPHPTPALRLAHTGHRAGPKLTQLTPASGPLHFFPPGSLQGWGLPFSNHPPRGAPLSTTGFLITPCPFGLHSFGLPLNSKRHP